MNGIKATLDATCHVDRSKLLVRDRYHVEVVRHVENKARTRIFGMHMKRMRSDRERIQANVVAVIHGRGIDASRQIRGAPSDEYVVIGERYFEPLRLRGVQRTRRFAVERDRQVRGSVDERR